MSCFGSPSHRPTKFRFTLAAVLILIPLSFASLAEGQTLFSATPLIDWTSQTTAYKTMPGYLYGGYYTGFRLDSTHDADGQAIAQTIQPLCHDGTTTGCNPGETPKIVVVGIGMSHWTKELCHDQGPYWQPQPCDPWSFIYKFENHTGVNPSVLVVDCALGGHPAQDWVSDDIIKGGMHYHLYTDCNNHLMNDLGVFPAQVQIVLLKQANTANRGIDLVPIPDNGLPQGCATNPVYGTDPDACVLLNELGTITRFFKANEYANTRMMFVTSRSYGGYATGLNPEPFAYETGFALKWLIGSQIRETLNGTVNDTAGSLSYHINDSSGTAPWIDWGTYQWAAGTMVPCQHCAIPGLTWRQDDYMNPQPTCPAGEECDFEQDNIHPSSCGRDKASNMLMYNLCNSAYAAPWIRSNPAAACVVNVPTNTCNYQ